ncbi:VanZ family protein [Micromonospora siamensis]|uniref:VanZ like family protein n=1 Tax=Micromonospora siamensis TaxID=299152 RepID=A0A1C5GWY8_9ACTN|nr:VanZ family protein [Micromonospora siamensis]SCG38107.1 VanZ like family protein [Micromonospora siamensis]
MDQVWRSWGGVLVVAAAAVPLAALATVLLARLRRDAPTRAQAWRRSLAEVGMVVGTAPWVWMILTPLDAPRRVDLVPLHDLIHLPDGSSAGEVAVQVVGNLLVFAALGCLAPVRWPALAGFGRLFLLGAAASATVETLQYALRLGRFSTVDDVLLNATGAALAGLLSRPWWAHRTATPVAATATPPR